MEDSSFRPGKLVVCFVVLTSAACLYGATVDLHPIFKLLYDIGPGLFYLASLVFMFSPSLIGCILIRRFGKGIWLERWEAKMLIGLSFPMGMYLCDILVSCSHAEASFMTSLYAAWKNWDNDPRIFVRPPTVFLIAWVMGFVWAALANVLAHPRRTWHRIDSWINSLPYRSQMSAYRGSPHESMEYGSAPQLEAGSGPAAAVPVDAFLGYWGERASVLKRTLWWAGLMLLLPAPVSLLCQRAVHHLFTLFPVQALGSDAAVEVIVLERVLISVSLGILCWILCAVLDVLLRRRPESTTPPYPAAGTDRQVAVTAVSTVLVISACLVALLCLTGINLHGTTAAS